MEVRPKVVAGSECVLEFERRDHGGLQALLVERVDRVQVDSDVQERLESSVEMREDERGLQARRAGPLEIVLASRGDAQAELRRDVDPLATQRNPLRAQE